MDNVLIIGIVLLDSLLTMVSFLSNNSGFESTERSIDIQQNMYASLRTLALPDASNAKDVPVTQRFVLQVPGKLLNPMDYDPTDYKADVTNRLSSFIPPVIEENMFHLTDIVPVANPMKGGETGESFVELYETVVYQLDVRGFHKKTEDDKKRYHEALNYLAQPFPDPENLSQNTTRLGMYIKLQKRYNDIRLDMEDKIKEAKDRHENDSVQYETWFQRNYPALYTNVENAYTEWLVFGQKDLVELYKAHLDVESQGVVIEEARMALRSSGKVSLDRASTIYPVHFEPSNWYEHLKVRPQSLSREQIQTKLSDFEAQLTVIESMTKNTSAPDTELIEKLQQSQDKAKTDLETKILEIHDKKLSCMKASEDSKKEKCQEYRMAQSEMTTLSTAFASQKATAEYVKFQLKANDESKETVEKLIASLEAQKKHYTSLLEMAPTDNTETNVPKISSESDTQDIQAGWMEFEFDSSTSSKSVDKSSKELAASMSFSAEGFRWGGVSHSRADQEFAERISQAEIKISAKILKVNIKRPWFRNSLFKLTDIKMRSNELVSPGPMSEPDFIKSLQNDSKFLLPQYVHAFLLAKDVKLKFQGVESSVTNHAMHKSVSSRLLGHYGPFSVSSLFNYGSSECKLKVQSTADGLHISIPGAQVIGYYVTVLPCFPKDTCN